MLRRFGSERSGVPTPSISNSREKFEATWPEPDVRDRWCQLLALLDPGPGERVLDVGFGRGQALQVIASMVGPEGSAIGIDTSPGFLAAARDTAGLAGSRVIAASADCLPFADETMDRVICVNVLEAMLDPMLALTEMLRVLRPGGTLAAAHDDYESLVFSGAEAELTQRIVGAFSQATLDGYAASDGRMGRKLLGLVRQAGFRETKIEVLPLVNTEFYEGLHGWNIAHLACELVGGSSGIPKADCKRWLDQLQSASKDGTYCYCLNLYVCVGIR